MPYVLGIDIGSTSTAAAVARLPGRDPAEPLRLGTRTDTVPSVLHLTEDGTVRAGTGGDGTVPVAGFLPRLGDDVPLLVRGEPYRPQTLVATLAGWVLDRAVERAGAPPEHVVIAHPAGWGPYRRGLLHEALWRAGLDRVTLLPEPLAAAEGYAGDAPVPVGGTLAVYLLGGTRCETSVVRRAPGGEFTVLASAAADEPLGGADLDDALTARVRAALGDRYRSPDPDDAAARYAVGWLRRQCVVAKEELSEAEQTTVRVALPDVQAEVRLTRTGLAEAVGPALAASVATLLRTLDAAGVAAGELTAVLLAGGTARVPLVGELITGAVAARVAVEADPELSVARGAALAGRLIVAPAGPGTGYPAPVSDGRPPVSAGAAGTPASDQPPPRPPVRVTPLEPPKRRSRRRATAD